MATTMGFCPKTTKMLSSSFKLLQFKHVYSFLLGPVVVIGSCCCWLLCLVRAGRTSRLLLIVVWVHHAPEVVFGGLDRVLLP